MTASEILKKECDDIIQRTGLQVPPYRLANMVKTVSKIMDLLIKTDSCTNYSECAFMLRLALNTIREVTGEEDR